MVPTPQGQTRAQAVVDQRGLGWAGALALLLLLVLPLCDRVLPATVVETTLGAPLFALAILAVASGALPTPRWLSGSTLVLLGRASYAVYIFHQPFKTVFMGIARGVGLATPSPALVVSFLCALELVCIGLFLWFEDPLRRLITRRRPLQVGSASGLGFSWGGAVRSRRSK